MRQVVTYKKWSFMRGSNWKALALLWIGGRLRHVIAYGGWLYHKTLHSSVLSLSKIYCLYRLDQGLQPSHQEGSTHPPADDGVPPPPPPLKLLRMITSFVRSTSDPFPIKSFHTLRHVFLSTPILCLHPEKINGVYLHTRSDGNLARLRAITKVRKVLIREMLS